MYFQFAVHPDMFLGWDENLPISREERRVIIQQVMSSEEGIRILRQNIRTQIITGNSDNISIFAIIKDAVNYVPQYIIDEVNAAYAILRNSMKR